MAERQKNSLPSLQLGLNASCLNVRQGLYDVSNGENRETQA